jgi:hypothetical protein
MSRVLMIVALLATAAGCATTQPSPNTPTPGQAAITAAGTECRVVDGRADRRCTPGALNPAVTQETIHSTICVPGWSRKVRPPAAFTNRIKRQAMANYGITDPPSTVELDHLIPIEDGGWPGDDQHPDDPRNLAQLWPESWTGTPNAHTKDAQENAVHAAICADRITLKQGQDQILAKWSQ